jgi:3-methylcrotonyl-CoA carboxylase beta subunit
MADRSEAPPDQSSKVANILTTKLDPTSARFEANMRFLADLMSQVRNEAEKISEGGGAKAIENQHAKGRLTARERIDLLVDTGSWHV